MKKYINAVWMLAVCLVIGASFTGCSDDEDFPNKPKKIDIEQAVVLTPINGGVKVDWTPDPADENFVFLHVSFKNQDGETCRYSMSRYNSNLVVPEWTDGEGNVTPNPNRTASTTITNLVNQEYTLNFAGYNNLNESIELGSRKVTPLDYKECLPDSIYAVSVKSGAENMVTLEWKEMPHKSGSTTKGVRFLFVNSDNGKTINKEYDLGKRRDVFQMEEEGSYKVTYGTYSELGKEVKSTLKQELLVGTSVPIEYWTKEDRAGWTITGCTEQVDYEDGRFVNMLDGNPSSYWHSSWAPNDGELPHHFVVDIQKSLTILSCLFQQRDQADRQVTEIAVYVSDDKESWGEPVYRGALQTGVKENCVKQSVDLTAKRGRFIKVETVAGTGGNFHCMSEFGIIARD